MASRTLRFSFEIVKTPVLRESDGRYLVLVDIYDQRGRWTPKVVDPRGE